VPHSSAVSQIDSASAASNSDVSIRWPRPVRSRATTAERIATAQNNPAERSLIGIPHLTGSPPGSPVTLMTPDRPWAIRSYPGRCAYGPVCPKPETLA
jgi:hypothetical protein